MARRVHLRGSPCGFDFADPVVEISGVRSLEVDHLVRREELPLLASRAVQISVDELLLAWDNLDVLRRHRPEFDGTVRNLVNHGMQICVSRELRIEDAENGRVVSVLVRVDLRQQLEDRMLIRDHFVLVAILRSLAERVHGRSVSAIAGKIRLRASRHARGLP